MKIALLFILLILSSTLFSQTKIYLTYHSGMENKNPYSIDNLKDTNYVYVYNHEDMGYQYAFNYDFVKNIEDGYYQIFINNILVRELFLKNHLPDKTDIRYSKKGKISGIESYANGKRNGLSKTFYDNGQLSSSAEYENDFAYLTTRYYGKGKVESRTFALPDRSNYRTENYDENGRIKATYDGYIINNSPILEIENKFKDGILDGEQRYVYKNFFYTIEYKMNELIKFTLRKDGIIIKTKDFR